MLTDPGHLYFICVACGLHIMCLLLPTHLIFDVIMHHNILWQVNVKFIICDQEDRVAHRGTGRLDMMISRMIATLLPHYHRETFHDIWHAAYTRINFYYESLYKMFHISHRYIQTC